MAVNLFWYGCNMTRHAEIIRLSARLLECVGEPVQPIGGPATCCGSPKAQVSRCWSAYWWSSFFVFTRAGRASVDRAPQPRFTVPLPSGKIQP